MKTNKKPNQETEKEFGDELFITSRYEDKANQKQPMEQDRKTTEHSQIPKENDSAETEQDIDDDREFNRSLLGGIDEKKYKYLMLTLPLKEGFVGHRYCSECGSLFSLTIKQFEAFMKVAGGPMDPKGFYPNYYIETDGCPNCRKTMDAFWIKKVEEI